MFGPLLNHATYFGIALGLVLTGMGLPVPEEVFLIVAGVASRDGSLNPYLALAACLVGAVLGDCLTYGIGYQFGQSVLRAGGWMARWLHPERERQMEEMIAHHGLKALLLARFLVGLRGTVYLAAGVLRVPFLRFLAVDAVSATAVVGTVFGLSYVFGNQIRGWWLWIRRAEVAFTVGVAAAVATVAVLLIMRHRRRKAALAEGEPGQSPPAPPVEPPLEAAEADDVVESRSVV
jgi:membrane protein DedA with SNARE-associated domain